jgi:carbohydrate kinase (thermoresistant glucokinase family)
MIVLVMGVSGSGKTTIGRPLAERLGWRFIDADDYHPPENVAKMTAGIPLEDADRWPWLDALNRILVKEKNAVVACSALKESYRRRLLEGIPDARVVYLHGAKPLIASRVEGRKHRYMPASLLDSQFATLEPPRGAIEVDVVSDPGACVAQIVSALSAASAGDPGGR